MTIYKVYVNEKNDATYIYETPTVREETSFEMTMQRSSKLLFEYALHTSALRI